MLLRCFNIKIEFICKIENKLGQHFFMSHHEPGYLIDTVCLKGNHSHFYELTLEQNVEDTKEIILSFSLEGYTLCCEQLGICVNGKEEHEEGFNVKSWEGKHLIDVKLAPDVEKKRFESGHLEGNSFAIRLFFGDGTVDVVEYYNIHNGYYSHGVCLKCWKFDIRDSI